MWELSFSPTFWRTPQEREGANLEKTNGNIHETNDQENASAQDLFNCAGEETREHHTTINNEMINDAVIVETENILKERDAIDLEETLEETFEETFDATDIFNDIDKDEIHLVENDLPKAAATPIIQHDKSINHEEMEEHPKQLLESTSVPGKIIYSPQEKIQLSELEETNPREKKNKKASSTPKEKEPKGKKRKQNNNNDSKKKMKKVIL